MEASNAWARRVVSRLKRRGFKVTLLSPAHAKERKEAARIRDLEAMAKGELTPAEIQTRNSLFGGRAGEFRIVDYGGLDDPV